MLALATVKDGALRHKAFARHHPYFSTLGKLAPLLLVISGQRQRVKEEATAGIGTATKEAGLATVDFHRRIVYPMPHLIHYLDDIPFADIHRNHIAVPVAIQVSQIVEPVGIVISHPGGDRFRRLVAVRRRTGRVTISWGRGRVTRFTTGGWSSRGIPTGRSRLTGRCCGVAAIGRAIRHRRTRAQHQRDNKYNQ